MLLYFYIYTPEFSGLVEPYAIYIRSPDDPRFPRTYIEHVYVYVIIFLYVFLNATEYSGLTPEIGGAFCV